MRVEVRTIRYLKEQFARGFPTVIGKSEGMLKANMLIDSGSEMLVLSRDLHQCAKGLLPVDTEISWSIGSANLRMDNIFGVFHSSAVQVGRIEISVPVFILEGASQEFNLSRTWDSLGHEQHDNWQDGLLYITITSLDDGKMATFCPVADHIDRDRDRLRILRLEDAASRETSLGTRLGNRQTIASDAGRFPVVRMI